MWSFQKEKNLIFPPPSLSFQFWFSIANRIKQYAPIQRPKVARGVLTAHALFFYKRHTGSVRSSIIIIVIIFVIMAWMAYYIETYI